MQLSASCLNAYKIIINAFEIKKELGGNHILLKERKGGQIFWLYFSGKGRKRRQGKEKCKREEERKKAKLVWDIFETMVWMLAVLLLYSTSQLLFLPFRNPYTGNNLCSPPSFHFLIECSDKEGESQKKEGKFLGFFNWTFFLFNHFDHTFLMKVL